VCAVFACRFRSPLAPPSGEPIEPTAWRMRRVLQQIISPFAASYLLSASAHAPSVPSMWAGVRRVRGRLMGNPGPGPNRPGRPRQAFLGTPSGSLRPLQVPRLPCGARVRRLLVPAANLRPLSALAGASGHVPLRRSPHAAPLLAPRRQRSQSGLLDLEPFALLPGAGRCHVRLVNGPIHVPSQAATRAA
jgi:hypothetical protein